MKVRIGSALHSYTGKRSVVEANGSTLGAVLEDLDRQFPGMRFRLVDEADRLRPHMRIFINTAEAKELKAPVNPDDEVHLLMALSGG